MTDPFRKTLPVVPTPAPVFCKDCAHHYSVSRPYGGGYSDHCRAGDVMSKPDPVTGETEISERGDCYTINAELCCRSFVPAPSLGERLDTLFGKLLGGQRG